MKGAQLAVRAPCANTLLRFTLAASTRYDKSLTRTIPPNVTQLNKLRPFFARAATCRDLPIVS
jgi:hypothetical protein